MKIAVVKKSDNGFFVFYAIISVYAYNEITGGLLTIYNNYDNIKTVKWRIKT